MTDWLPSPTLATPGFLLLGLLVPIALVVRRLRGEPAVLFAPGRFAAAVPRTLRVRLRHLPGVLSVAGLLVAVVAIARPIEHIPTPAAKEGIDILLALDLSSSMAANDMDPEQSRLAVAKAEAIRFVAGRPNDRIGLLCFARYPDLRCPPTLDHDALSKMIAAVERVEGDGPEDATGIGTATARAIQVLSGSGTGSRVMILLTDGEENVATPDKPGEIAPLHAGQLARKLGIRIYAIAAGLGRRNADGEWVLADTRDMRSLAERSGGRFFEARDADAATAVYGEIDRLETAAAAETNFRVEERFLPWLVSALVLLVVGQLLGSTVLAVKP